MEETFCQLFNCDPKKCKGERSRKLREILNEYEENGFNGYLKNEPDEIKEKFKVLFSLYYESAFDLERSNLFYNDNIDLATKTNNEYGPVVQYNDPSGHIQVALMSIPPLKTVPWETHKNLSQFIRVEAGEGFLFINDELNRIQLYDGMAAVVPANHPHLIINSSSTKPLKLYTIYSKDSNDKFEH